jgi:hypothetical protein
VPHLPKVCTTPEPDLLLGPGIGELVSGSYRRTLGSTVLQTAAQSYQTAAMTSDHDRARRSMENKTIQAGEETTAISTEYTITREEMDQFLAGIIVDDPARTIINIAWNFLSARSELEALVQQSLKESQFKQ